MADDVKKAIKRLDNIKLTTLSLSQIQKLQQANQDQRIKLTETVAGIEEQTQQMLLAGNPDVLTFTRKRTSRFSSDLQEITEFGTQLENQRQKVIIKQNMISFLGTSRRLVILEAVIMSLIALVLGLLVYDSIAGDDSTRPNWLTGDSIFLIDTVCCIIFMSEFIFRMCCAESKKYVWRNHWIDFVTSIPIPGEAQLARFGRVARLARFARIMRMLRFLRFLRVFLLVWRGMDKLQHVIDVKLMKKTLRWSILITLTGAFLVYQLEGIQAGSVEGELVEANPVGSYPLALWWSFTTVVTGGFGDIHNPNSISGQLLTAGLVITGMILIGVFTATLTSLFVGEQSEEIEQLQENMTSQIEQINRQMELMTQQLDKGTAKPDKNDGRDK